MKIALIDVDSHNFPNIPLMKISAWHKQNGDSVEWYELLKSGHMDKVYMSKVFSFTPDYPFSIDTDEIIRGGSGYAISAIDEKEVYCSCFSLRCSDSLSRLRSILSGVGILPSGNHSFNCFDAFLYCVISSA